MPLKDCRECSNSIYLKGTYHCTAFGQSKPTSWMRDPRNECGLEARLFDTKEDRKYSEYEE
jgi:hypothetical protein